MSITQEKNRRIKMHSNRESIICNLKSSFLFSFFGCIWIKGKGKTLEWENNSESVLYLLSGDSVFMSLKQEIERTFWLTLRKVTVV